MALIVDLLRLRSEAFNRFCFHTFSQLLLPREADGTTGTAWFLHRPRAQASPQSATKGSNAACRASLMARVSIRWCRGAGARAACGQLALVTDEPSKGPIERGNAP